MKIISNPETYKEKEALYIDVRRAEGRVISNDILQMLPSVADAFTHKKEWDIRADNFLQLVKHINKSFSGRSIYILDIGCGNGWMSNRLAGEGHFVTGLDLNLTELKQAEEVFGETSNLEWIYADILSDRLNKQYDLILFSASCQYFPTLEELNAKLQPILNGKGEIHFHDSVFYKNDALEQAQKRSFEYYTELGFPEMAGYYFHHSIDTLQHLGYKNMNRSTIFFKKPILEWWMKKK